MSAQSMSALARATEVRMDRARIKRELKAGRRDVVTLVLEPPDSCRNLTVFELLDWVPRVGPHRAARTIRGVVTETITLDRLSPPTRAKLAERIRERLG